MAASDGSEYFELNVEAGIEGGFARASNAESVREDEDELVWAALESLPSQKRTNFALLRQTDNGEERTEAVDVRKLDRPNRELVVKRALATTEQDDYKLLSAIKERLNRLINPSSLSLSSQYTREFTTVHGVHQMPIPVSCDV